MDTRVQRESEGLCYAYGREDGANGDPERYRTRVSPHAFASRVANTDATWGQFRVIYDEMLAAVTADESAKRDRIQRGMS